MRFTQRFLERFRKRLMDGIRVDEETGCWVWERYQEQGEPARIQLNRAFGGESYKRRRHYQVNYMVYQLVVGELPDEPFRFEKKQSCYYMNRCVNPFHSDIRLTVPIKERYTLEQMQAFALNVIIDMHTGCWSCPEFIEGRRMTCTEISWMMYRGDVPDNVKIIPMCSTNGCCNPIHITLKYIPVLVDLIDREDGDPWNETKSRGKP